MVVGGIAAAAWSVALVLIDVSHRRLPDILTLPAAAAALVVCCADPSGWWGLAWPAVYLALGTGIGGGDVKLAVPLGVALALVGGIGAVLAAMLFSSVLTLAVLALVKRQSAPHGPAMLAAAWMVGLTCATMSDI